VLSVVGVALVGGCAVRHTAHVAPPTLPPLPAKVQHSGRLWIVLAEHTDDQQCSRPPGNNRLCFADVHGSLAAAIAQTSWSSFPGVALKQKGDELVPGDYVLLVDLDLHPLPPSDRGPGPGWSAAGYASWKLVRDGMPIASGNAASKSRSDFAYGSGLGIAAGEVIGAISAHISDKIVALPERRPLAPVPLPPIAQR
jgi:hypothetical protein